MVWVSSIDKLDFYSRGASDYCYCDLLIQPNDLAIQGNLGKNSAATSLLIQMYTPDGKTWIDDLTIYFDWYVAKVNGYSFFNARLRFFPPVMCDNRCFVLRVVATSEARVVFDMWTQQYCLADCCSVPEDVIITGPGVTTGAPSIPKDVTSPKDSTCRPLLRIRPTFQCVDNWAGEYWGMPNDTDYINGSVTFDKMFRFAKVLNITGSILDMPYELTRTITVNCNVQRSESKRLYEVQSFEEFPVWKMLEISDMLHADTLEVNGELYKYPGGTPFETLYPKKLKKRYFRLKFPLHGCLIYQNFGCGDKCEGRSKKRYYAIEDPHDTYHTDAGLEIGDFEDVVIWFETSGGGGFVETGGAPPILIPEQEASDPWKVNVITPDELDLATDYFAIIEVEGENLPAYIYGDGTRPSDRIYAQELINEDYNALFGVGPNYVACKVPVIGSPTFYDMICVAPTIGAVTYIDECQTPVIGVILYGDLDEEPPVSLTNYILAETGDTLAAENGDLLIQE